MHGRRKKRFLVDMFEHRFGVNDETLRTRKGLSDRLFQQLVAILLFLTCQGCQQQRETGRTWTLSLQHIMADWGIGFGIKASDVQFYGHLCGSEIGRGNIIRLKQVNYLFLPPVLSPKG